MGGGVKKVIWKYCVSCLCRLEKVIESPGICCLCDFNFVQVEEDYCEALHLADGRMLLEALCLSRLKEVIGKPWCLGRLRRINANKTYMLMDPNLWRPVNTIGTTLHVYHWIACCKS